MFSEFLDPSADLLARPTSVRRTRSADLAAPRRTTNSTPPSCTSSTRSSTRPASESGCPRARHRLRLGEPRDPRSAARRRRVTAITIASQQALLAQQPDRRSRRRRPGPGRAARLPRPDRRVRRRAERRDDRGGRREVLAGLLRRDRTHGSRPDGVAVVQAIVMPHERMLGHPATRSPGCQKYIFPGGLIPSVKVIEDVTNQHTGLHAQVLRSARAGLRAHPADLAQPLRRPVAEHLRPSASTTRSGGCGSSTWRTPRRASARATWTTCSCC